MRITELFNDLIILQIQIKSFFFLTFYHYFNFIELKYSSSKTLDCILARYCFQEGCFYSLTVSAELH